jgi:hypothetical protein
MAASVLIASTWPAFSASKHSLTRFYWVTTALALVSALSLVDVESVQTR